MTVRLFYPALGLGLAATLALAACGDTSGGGAQKTGGDIKEGVGKLTGSERLQREGKTDQVVGGVKETAQDAKDAVHDAVH